ncbi:MAG: hypothetical protein UV36_C0003G0010 [Parcubacteria group bacterium GW2011_GWC2_42_6]|nr:MAG: hypothetical protein UV36_C0003G0010 [Parcubacteria group bacterium GW2011_GWC2_42_6]
MFYQSPRPKNHFFIRLLSRLDSFRLRLFRRRQSGPTSRSRWKRTKKIILWLLAIFFIIGVASFLYIAKDLPNPKELEERQITESTKIYDRTGQVILYDIHGEEKRTVIAFNEIPDSIKNATIAVEDANFYHHFGLDFKGIARAVWGVITGNRSAGGGSTITQQFIKKSFFSDKRSYIRKFKEWILALELEIKYSKDEILGFYLNQIPYGSNAYGIEAAAQTFFNKPAKDLTLAESALLVSLPQAPTYYSPFGSHPEELRNRQEYVLNRMTELGYISSNEAETAKQEELKFVYRPNAIKAPHFVMYIKEYLEEKYGADAVEKTGLKVYTTLDWDMQQAAEKIISDGAASNEKKYRAGNAALVALDPKTGQILTMVGSRDYFDIEHDGNVNVTIRPRQPGSSFKPFAYVTAFANGYTPDTILFDLKTEFNPNCSADANSQYDQYGIACYNPGNYDDKFRGPVTARQALAQSLNIPAVQMLYLAGINDTIKTAKAMGINLASQYYGLSLVLGGGEVKLLEQTAAYGVFAAEGVKHAKTAILKIEKSNGEILEEYKDESEKVLEPQLTRLISNILSDNNARAPVFGTASPLYFPERQVAAKTGTTEQYRDAWTMGYTPSLVVGLWVGNNNNTPMSKAGAGISAAGPLWHNFIKQAYELKSKKDCQPNEFCLPPDPEQFTKPQPIVANKAILNGSYINTTIVKINKISGALATDATPPELIAEVPYKEVHNILYYCRKDDPLGSAPGNPTDDPQYFNWETAVQAWAAAQGDQLGLSNPPINDNTDNPANRPKIKIISPLYNQTINKAKFEISVEATAALGVKQVDYFLNEEYLGTTAIAPYQLAVSLPDSFLNKSDITQAVLKARVYDKALSRQEDNILIFIAPEIKNRKN